MTDTGIQHCHDVECLHHIRAVVARKTDVGGELMVAADRFDLIDYFVFDLGPASADL